MYIFNIMPGWSDILISNPKSLLGVPVPIQLAILNLKFQCPWSHTHRVHSYRYSPDSCQPWLVISWNSQQIRFGISLSGLCGFWSFTPNTEERQGDGVECKGGFYLLVFNPPVQSVMRLSAGAVPIPWIKGRNYWVLKWDLRIWDEKFSDFYFSAQMPLPYASEPHSLLVIFLSFLKSQTSLFGEVTALLQCVHSICPQI